LMFVVVKATLWDLHHDLKIKREATRAAFQQ